MPSGLNLEAMAKINACRGGDIEIHTRMTSTVHQRPTDHNTPTALVLLLLLPLPLLSPAWHHGCLAVLALSKGSCNRMLGTE